MSIEFTALDADNFVRPLTALSHINVHAHRRAPTGLCKSQRSRARPCGTCC